MDKNDLVIPMLICFAVVAILMVWFLFEIEAIKVNWPQGSRAPVPTGPILTQEAALGLIELGKEIETREQAKRIIINPFGSDGGGIHRGSARYKKETGSRQKSPWWQ